MSLEQILFLMATIVIAYPIVMRLLARAVQPRRDRIIAISDILSRDEKLQPEWREMVAWMVMTAHSAGTMMRVAMYIPLFLVDNLRGKVEPAEPILDKETDDLVNEFTGHHIASIAAANPIFAFIVSLELAMIIFFFYPFGRGAIAVKAQFAALVRAERAGHTHIVV